MSGRSESGLNQNSSHKKKRIDVRNIWEAPNIFHVLELTLTYAATIIQAEV